MEVTFATKEIRNVCTSVREAESAHGIGVANALRRILADLRAAKFLAEFALLYSLEIHSETIQIAIGEGTNLTLSVAHRIIPLRHGMVDASKVHRVMVVALGEREGE